MPSAWPWLLLLCVVLVTLGWWAYLDRRLP